jgi:hypothetical protein
VLPGKDAGADKVQILSGRLAEARAEIEKVKTRLQAKYSDAVADVLDRHEAERKALAEELARAQQAAASPAREAWGQCHTLIDALDNAPDAEEARVRLRAAVRRVVESVWVLTVRRGHERLAAVQLWFADGKKHRDYLILHRPATGGSVGTRPARWWVRSLAEVARPGDLDLRRREDARALEVDLATLVPEDLADAEG